MTSSDEYLKDLDRRVALAKRMHTEEAITAVKQLIERQEQLISSLEQLVKQDTK